jgi:O-antigen ligase
MPEHLRALVVILVLTATFFAVVRNSACAITTPANFTLRRNIWFLMTLAAFLTSNFWLFMAIAILILKYATRREPSPPALYFFILFALPVAYVSVPGMGLINYIFDISYGRILVLFILLPAYFTLRRQSGNPSFGRTGTDKALAIYLILVAFLYLRDGNTFTNVLRQSFYLFIDVFVPYYVVSRSLKDMQTFRDALLSLVLAIMTLATMSVFESVKSWLLYTPLVYSLNMGGGMSGYLARDGILRVIVSTGQPIALGYVMVVGIGLYLFLQRSIQRPLLRQLGMALLVAGLIAPLSRGPWIGAVVLWVVFIATGRYAVRSLSTLALATVLIFPLVPMLPGGERVINLLPFVGTIDQSNADYRDRLITNSMIVIGRSPWFGSTTYYDTPEMESMRQGEGIIDVVNTYLSITLETGWIGVSLFVSIFILTLLGIYRAMRSIPDKTSDEYLLGRALLATQLSIMVIIFTVSSITVIPIVYWSFVGLGVAYAQMVRRNTV